MYTRYFRKFLLIYEERPSDRDRHTFSNWIWSRSRCSVLQPLVLCQRVIKTRSLRNRSQLLCVGAELQNNKSKNSHKSKALSRVPGNQLGSAVMESSGRESLEIDGGALYSGQRPTAEETRAPRVISIREEECATFAVNDPLLEVTARSGERAVHWAVTFTS